MGSVSSTNPGVANVLQTLANVNSPVLSAPNVVSALEKASPSDIVKLSAAATELQGVAMMFGGSAATSDGTSDPLSSLIATLDASLTARTTAGAPGAATTSPSSTDTGSSLIDLLG